MPRGIYERKSKKVALKPKAALKPKVMLAECPGKLAEAKETIRNMKELNSELTSRLAISDQDLNDATKESITLQDKIKSTESSIRIVHIRVTTKDGIMLHSGEYGVITRRETFSLTVGELAEVKITQTIYK